MKKGDITFAAHRLYNFSLLHAGIVPKRLNIP